MLRLAVLTARKRLGTFVGAFLALAGSAVLVMAGAMLLQAALRTHPPVTRYAAADAVVTGHQDVGPDRDVILGEPVRIPASNVSALARVVGVRAAVGDSAAPARLVPPMIAISRIATASAHVFRITVPPLPRARGQRRQARCPGEHGQPLEIRPPSVRDRANCMPTTIGHLRRG